jgi:hypothetical protein
MPYSHPNPKLPPGRGGVDYEVVHEAAVPSDFRKLRHLGFRKILIEAGKEHRSVGPSYLDQLGYCAQGNVNLTVFGYLQPKQRFDLGRGYIFFLPSGSQFIFENDALEQTTIIMCSARHKFDIRDADNDGPIARLLERQEAGPLLQASAALGYEQDNGYADWNVEDDSPHVVLFFDPPESEDDKEGTIAESFSHDVVAREFGIAEGELPVLEFGLHDALVIAPIDLDLTAN